MTYSRNVLEYPVSNCRLGVIRPNLLEVPNRQVDPSYQKPQTNLIKTLPEYWPPPDGPQKTIKYSRLCQTLTARDRS